jgi:hypothetical protein
VQRLPYEGETSSLLFRAVATLQQQVQKRVELAPPQELLLKKSQLEAQLPEYLHDGFVRRYRYRAHLRDLRQGHWQACEQWELHKHLMAAQLEQQLLEQQLLVRVLQLLVRVLQLLEQQRQVLQLLETVQQRHLRYQSAQDERRQELLYQPEHQ